MIPGSQFVARPVCLMSAAGKCPDRVVPVLEKTWNE
uniref:Uncharacterized protein n=1 Tax=Setaria viridis TaxID=4556 RepID=A0A4U6WCK6_SETVI|nr:hypothetical protein SEVIR_1G249950v2 [Setaria viridis]